MVLLGAAGVLLFRYFTAASEDGEDLPGGTFWMCRNPDCGFEFNLPLKTMKEQMNADGRVPCPKCGQHLTKRGFQCPACQRVVEPVGHGALPEKCRHCNEPIPVPDGG